MKFEREKFTVTVFKICHTQTLENTEFGADTIIKKIYSEIGNEETGYWQKKSVTHSMSDLERMKLISGQIRPEFTPNHGFLIEAKYGRTTKLGDVFQKLPQFFQISCIYIFLRRKSFLAILGVLSFVRLAHNASSGLEIIAGWSSYLAAFVLMYLMFIILKRLIN